MNNLCDCRYCTEKRKLREAMQANTVVDTVEELAIPEVKKPRVIIKEFTYAQTRQHFVETNVTDGTMKEDYFRIPERNERVIHSDNATIVILHDGTKGVAKCNPTDELNYTKGIKIAYTRAKIKLLQKELKKLTK